MWLAYGHLRRALRRLQTARLRRRLLGQGSWRGRFARIRRRRQIPGSLYQIQRPSLLGCVIDCRPVTGEELMDCVACCTMRQGEASVASTIDIGQSAGSNGRQTAHHVTIPAAR